MKANTNEIDAIYKETIADTGATISQMVRKDYRMADVFKKWGINYCCGGNLPLEKVCALQNIDRAALDADLQQATQTLSLPSSTAFDQWPLTFLTDYIIHVHHGYIKNVLPALKAFLSSYVPGHLKQFPHLAEVQEAFLNLATELEEHTEREEESIFPYVKQIINTYNRKEVYGNLFVRTMSRPLAGIIQNEHSRIVFQVKFLRELTHNYTFAPGACTNYQVLYNKLKEFDADLVQHKHLENNFLFPRAIEMEMSLLKL
jgi:regulator of cell morphogenesis and NO signaling